MFCSQEVFNMRILYVVHQFFPKWYTGTERFVLNLANQMRRMGHYVEVLTYGFEDNTGFSIHDGIMCKRYKFQNIPVTSVRHLNVPKDTNFNIFDKKLGNILDKIITKENFDIVHVAHPMRVGYAIKVANSEGLPVVLTLTDFWIMCPRVILVTSKGELCNGCDDGLKCITECFGDFLKNKILKRIEDSKEVFQITDCVVSATNFLKKMFEINDFSSDIKLIRFGIDYNNVRHNLKEYSEKSEITFGFLSTLQPNKGADILLEAFYKANIENIRLKIYGHYFHEKDYYEMLKRIAKENKKIEFFGEYKYEEMPDILDEIDVIVIPSRWYENTPLTLLRALAHNVPAIVSDLGGMTEVVKDGKNGFTFEAGSAESLAEVLRKVGLNPTILNEMKNKIHHPPRIEEEAFEYEKIYSNLMEELK